MHAAVTQDVAILLKHRGTVKIGNPRTKQWQDAQKGMHLNSGHVVRTRAGGFAAVMFSDDKTLLKIRENSTVVIGGKRDQTTISKRLRVTLGQIWLNVSKQKSDLQVETPSGMATVKGTEFYTIVDERGNSTIICIRGLISMLNKFGTIMVRSGETGILPMLSAPSKFKTKPEDIPTWANSASDLKELKFEFQDADGKKKSIIIEYENR